MTWISRINKALKSDGGYRLTLVAQPILPIQATIGTEPTFYEILLRLVNPDGTVISAGEFIDSISLDPGLMVKVDWWVLNSTADLIALTGKSYAVNLGTAILRSPYFPQELSNRLSSKAIKTSSLSFEVTEREMLHSVEIDHLKMIDENHKILLDDVGTVLSRHSLFAYFASTWVSGVKLDINLVSQVLTNWRSARVNVGLFSMCSDFGLICICEGVESVEV